MQACQLARIAVEGTSVQGLGHSVEVARRAQPAEAVAHTLNFHLESLLFGQVIEGPHDALPWRAHIEEFRSVRLGTVAFFRSLPEGAWARSGIASDNHFTVQALAFIIAGHFTHHAKILRTQYL